MQVNEAIIAKATLRFAAVFTCVVSSSVKLGNTKYVIFYGVVWGRFPTATMRCGAVFRRVKVLRCGVVRLTALNCSEPSGGIPPKRILETTLRHPQRMRILTYVRILSKYIWFDNIAVPLT